MLSKRLVTRLARARKYWPWASSSAVATFATALMISVVQAVPPTKSSTSEAKASCGDYGTAIEFEPTPKDAAKRAAKEEKLVMVLHVSGHFEDPRLT